MFFLFHSVTIDFQMLNQPCTPQVNPLHQDVLSFSYIARFDLLILLMIFVLSVICFSCDVLVSRLFWPLKTN